MVTSVAATIDDMTSKFKVAIIEEFSMQTMAEMMEEKTLLDRAFITSFLSGPCKWTGVTKKSEDDCDELILESHG